MEKNCADIIRVIRSYKEEYSCFKRLMEIQILFTKVDLCSSIKEMWPSFYSIYPTYIPSIHITTLTHSFTSTKQNCYIIICCIFGNQNHSWKKYSSTFQWSYFWNHSLKPLTPKNAPIFLQGFSLDFSCHGTVLAVYFLVSPVDKGVLFNNICPLKPIISR